MDKEPRILDFPIIQDPRGNLTFLEETKQLPFKIERVYWIYDVPGGEFRGGHAYHELEEVIIALSGSFRVVLNDGVKEKSYTLNRSYHGLYVPKMMWRRLEDFSTNALCLILANRPYEKGDYIRDFDRYKKLIKS